MHCANCRIYAAVSRKHDYGKTGNFGCDFLQHFFAADARHTQVGNYKVNVTLVYALQTFFAVFGNDSVVAVHLKRSGKSFAYVFFIIYNQYLKFHLILPFVQSTLILFAERAARL